VLQHYKFDLPGRRQHYYQRYRPVAYTGPESDAGLTGRKIVVDTYGGFARVGGGAFSGKDPSKVDRSGAYAAATLLRQLSRRAWPRNAKSALAYVIGRPKPLMQTIYTFGTAKASDRNCNAFKDKLIDTSVKALRRAGPAPPDLLPNQRLRPLRQARPALGTDCRLVSQKLYNNLSETDC